MATLRIAGVCVKQVNWLVATVLLLAVASGFAAAQETGLIEKIAAARQHLRPLDAADVNAARTKLQAAIKRLDATLVRNGDTVRDSWRAYLRWETLEAQANAETPDLALLSTIRDSMRRQHASLDHPSFTNLRSELTDFIGLMVYAQTPNQIAAYESLLDRLSTDYATAQTDPNPNVISTLGRIADRLESAHQAPEVVAHLRREFNQPNVMARVSGAFIASNSERPVDDTRPVSEVILGTHQRGTARTVGTVSVRPVPSQTRAQFQATLDGISTGSNVGTRSLGRNTLVINSSSHSTVSAHKLLFLSPNGLQTSPANAQACTRSTIHSICAPNLLANFVRRQVFKNKAQAEAIAASRLERRTADSFDERVSAALNESRENLRREVRAPLQRLDAAPQSWHSWTTSDAMMIEALQANSEQLGRIGSAPALDASADVALALHETAINNLAEAVFGGKRVTDRQVAEWVEIGSGDLPRELRVTQDNRWSITFAAYQPMTVEFAPGAITVRLRGSKFERGDESVNDLIEIAASYLVERTETGVRFTRQGEVEVSFPGREVLNLERRGIQTFMQDKFKAVFPEQGETTGIRFPGNFADRAPLKLSLFDLHDGWVNLSWKQAAAQ